jgi:glyoxylase I family protein
MTTPTTNGPIGRLHHFAIGTKDMAKTKAFYSGLLGLRHSQTWKEEFPDPKRGALHYMHCFFELGDGSALAFFQFAKGDREDPERLPRQVFDHHIALRVETKDDMLAIKAKYEAANQAYSVVDHGYCWSMYTRDPNGMLVEIAVDPPGVEKVFERKAVTADKELEEFLSGDYSVSNHERSYEKSVLPISDMQDIVNVMLPSERN